VFDDIDRLRDSSDDRVVEQQTLAPLRGCYELIADKDAMTATAQTQRRLSVMTDINVLIIVGLRAGSVHRVLAKVAAAVQRTG